ncbi:hypothetical protein [Celerinatantimonas sp. YJH-8]|uniref:hypothetical protein n=1 Tax=Celerinatantimonas sp. YJH-8 TaxID=3228714 RepID=UPI0038C27B8B
MTNFVVSRKLKLAQSITPEQQDILSELPGLMTWDVQGNTFQVKYDASQLQLSGIMELAGLKPATNKLQQWRIRYYQFTDQNLAQESGHVPHCCNKLPR